MDGRLGSEEKETEWRNCNKATSNSQQGVIDWTGLLTSGVDCLPHTVHRAPNPGDVTSFGSTSTVRSTWYFSTRSVSHSLPLHIHERRAVLPVGVFQRTVPLNLIFQGTMDYMSRVSTCKQYSLARKLPVKSVKNEPVREAQRPLQRKSALSSFASF